MTKQTDPAIWVALSRGQAETIVGQVADAGGPGGSLVRVLLALGGHDRVVLRDLQHDLAFHNPKHSQLLLTSLLVLGPFHDGKPQSHRFGGRIGSESVNARSLSKDMDCGRRTRTRDGQSPIPSRPSMASRDQRRRTP